MAITVALVSLLKNICVSTYTAITGEISLHGNVLPVGGIKEKLLSAEQAERNRKDLKEIPETILNNLNVKTVASIWEAFDICGLIEDINIAAKL